MLLMIEKGIRGGICHAILSYVNGNKYMKNYDKNKKSSYLMYWLIYMDGQCQKFPTGCFKWPENTPPFNKDFIKNYNEDCDLEVDQYPEKLHEMYNDLLFFRKNENWES